MTQEVNAVQFDFSELAAAAVRNNYNNGSTPSYLLSIEEARKAVKVKDGNRKAAEDGSQALTLILGRVALSLDVIAKGATRINATKDQVEAFSAKLVSAVEAGAFDAAIVEAQAKANPANKVGEGKQDLATLEAATEQKELTAETAPEGLDLDALEDELV